MHGWPIIFDRGARWQRGPPKAVQSSSHRGSAVPNRSKLHWTAVDSPACRILASVTMQVPAGQQQATRFPGTRPSEQGGIRASPRSAAQPLHTKFPNRVGGCFLKATIGRDLPRRLSALSVFPSKSVLYGAFGMGAQGA
jgi:hypothetical protein